MPSKKPKPSMEIYVERDGDDVQVSVEYDCDPEDALLGIMGAVDRIAEGMEREPLEVLALIAYELVRQKTLKDA